MADIQKVIKLKELPKLIKKEEKEISSGVSVVNPINIKEEEEEENIDIKNVGLLLDTDFAINLAKHIVNQQKHNKLTRDSNKIYIDLYTLGIENNKNNIAKLMHYLKVFKDRGGVGDCYIDDVRITINKPRIKELQTYIKEFNDLDSKIENEEGRYSVVKLPSNISWEDISIRFFDRQDFTVMIKKGGYSKMLRMNYKELGFQDGRTRKPNKQWGLFLSLSASDGEINWENVHANKNIVKTKQLLSKQLKKSFGIDEDPFFDYYENNSYKIKLEFITLKNIIRDIKNVYPDEDIDNEDGYDIKDFYNEQINKKSSRKTVEYLGDY